jgi:transcription elongation GreA/GreB family factor
MQIAKRPRAKPRIADDEPVYLTPEGVARMQARLARLKREVLDLATEAGRTAAFGDRSENAAYKDAKSALRRTQRQIWTLEDQLKRVVEIKPGPKAAGTVQLGSVVTMEIKNGIQKKFQILGTLETNPDRGIISHKSPLGAALIGRMVGETIFIQTARGKQEYKILKVA